MTTRFDIQDAKQAYEDHLATHHCKLGDGCHERIRLWKIWVGSSDSVTARWGLDADDNTRQRRQFYERFPNATHFPAGRSSVKKAA